MSDSIRIVEMPDIGAVTDASSVVGERAGSGRFSAPAVKTYVSAGLATAADLTTEVNARLAEASEISVKENGAVGDGAADDTAAIQATIDAAAIAGKGVFLPAGNYKITATLTIGNGGVGVVSTQRGVVLRGSGNPAMIPYFAGFSAQASPSTITWAGATSGVMLSVRGPVQSWGVQNLHFNAASSAGFGIAVSSGSFGDNRNLYIEGCRAVGIYSTCIAPFGSVPSTNSFHSSWRNISVLIPAVTGARGIHLSGTNSVSATTCFNLFDNVAIAFTSSAQINHGLYLDSCDTNQFHDLEFLGGNGSNTICVLLDYAMATPPSVPGGNLFFGLETEGVTGVQQFVNNGAPGVNARPNLIFGTPESNSSTHPNLANLQPSLPAVVTPTINIANRTTAIASTVMATPWVTGLFRASVALSVAATGASQTVMATITWNDGTANQSAGTATVNASSNGAVSSVFLMRVQGGTGISYVTTLSGSLGTGSYNLYVLLERLS